MLRPFCGRESSRSEGGSPQPKSRAHLARDLLVHIWCREGESNPHSPFGPADFKLRRFAGVSPNEVRTGARSRNPERSFARDLLLHIWCREGESNPHSPFGPADFKSAASANFAIPASSGQSLLLESLSVLHSSRAAASRCRPRKSPARKSRDLQCRGLSHSSLCQQLTSLQMDHLSIRVQSTVHFHFLAFELLHLILMVDVVGVPSSRILEHIFVTRLYDHTHKTLRTGGLILRIARPLSSLVGRWTGFLILLRLVWWRRWFRLRIRGRGLRRRLLRIQRDGYAEEKEQSTHYRQGLNLFFHEILQKIFATHFLVSPMAANGLPNVFLSLRFHESRHLFYLHVLCSSHDSSRNASYGASAWRVQGTPYRKTTFSRKSRTPMSRFCSLTFYFERIGPRLESAATRKAPPRPPNCHAPAQ